MQIYVILRNRRAFRTDGKFNDCTRRRCRNFGTLYTPEVWCTSSLFPFARWIRTIRTI